MLLRNRSPKLDETTPVPSAGFERLSGPAICLLRWLEVSRVDHVLVGALARMIRSGGSAEGPVAIVLAPYGRNFERLERALAPFGLQMRAARLAAGETMSLRCAGEELELETCPESSLRYQELLYEATRFTIAEAVGVEVAAPEDIEHYDHLRRTGEPPELRITRAPREPAAGSVQSR